MTSNRHYKSLDIPLPLTFNNTTIQSLEETSEKLDGRLATNLKQIRMNIDKIHETSNTTTFQIITYVTMGLTTLNTIALLVIIRFLTQTKPRRQQFYVPKTEQPTKDRICADCDVPLDDDLTNV